MANFEATGQITLTSVLDGFMISISPSRFIIPTDENGRGISNYQGAGKCSLVTKDGEVSLAQATSKTITNNSWVTLADDGTFTIDISRENIATLDESGYVTVTVEYNNLTREEHIYYEKARQGATGEKGEDALSIVLSNEYQMVPVDFDNLAIEESFTTDIQVYKGNNLVAYSKSGNSSFPYYTITTTANSDGEAPFIEFIDNAENRFYAAAKIYTRGLNSKVKELVYPLTVTYYYSSTKTLTKTAYVRLNAASNITQTTIKMVFNSNNYYKFYESIDPEDTSKASYGYTPSSIEVGITYQEDNGLVKRYTLPSTSTGNNYSGYKVGFFGIVKGEWKRIPDENIIYDSSNQTYYIPFTSLDNKKLWDSESIKAAILYKSDNSPTEEVILQEEIRTLAFGTQEQAARFNFLTSGAYWDVNGLNYTFDDDGIKISKREETGVDEDGNPTYIIRDLFSTRNGNLYLENSINARTGSIGNWDINDYGMISSDGNRPAGVYAPEGTVYYDYTAGETKTKEDFFNQYLSESLSFKGNPIEFELKQNSLETSATIEIIPEQLGQGIPSVNNYRRIVVVGNGESWEKEYLDTNLFTYNDGDIGYDNIEAGDPPFTQQDEDGYIYSNGTIVITLDKGSVTSAYKWIQKEDSNSSIDIHIENKTQKTSNDYQYEVSNFYGGTLNIESKTLSHDWIKKEIASPDDYSYNPNNNTISIPLSKNFPVISTNNIIFSHGVYSTSSSQDTCYILDNNIIVYLNNLTDKTKTGYDTYIAAQKGAGTPLTFYYKTLSPLQELLSDIELLSLSLGTNSIRTNGSSITLSMVIQEKPYSEYAKKPESQAYKDLISVVDNTGLVFYAGQPITNRIGIINNNHTFKTNRTHAFSVLGNGLIYAQSLITDGTIYSNNAINIINEDQNTHAIDLQKHILGNTSVVHKGFNNEIENIFLGINHLNYQNVEAPYTFMITNNGTMYAGAGIIRLSAEGLFFKKGDTKWFSGISTNNDGNNGYPSFWIQTSANTINSINDTNTKFLIDNDGVVFSQNSILKEVEIKDAKITNFNSYEEPDGTRFKFNVSSFNIEYDEKKEAYVTYLQTIFNINSNAFIQSGSIIIQSNSISGNSFLIDDEQHFARYDTIRATNLETVNFVKENVNTVNGSLLLTNSGRVSDVIYTDKKISHIILDDNEATMEVGYVFAVNDVVDGEGQRLRYYVKSKQNMDNNKSKYEIANFDKEDGEIRILLNSLLQIYGAPTAQVIITPISETEKTFNLECANFAQLNKIKSIATPNEKTYLINNYRIQANDNAINIGSKTVCKLISGNFNDFISSLQKSLVSDDLSYSGEISVPTLPSFSKIYLKTNAHMPEITLFSSSDVSRTNDDSLTTIEATNANNLTLRIGNLSTIVDDVFGGQLKGNGLYSENAYLKGSLVLPRAGILNSSTSENIFNFSAWNGGDTSIGNFIDSPIRIWAGAPVANRKTAPFIVTEDGSLYASKGVFKGSIYADNGVFRGFLESTGVLLSPNHSMNFFFAKKKDGNDATYGEADYIINVNENGLEIYDDSFAIFSGQPRTKIKQLYCDYLPASGQTLSNPVFNYQLPYVSTSDKHMSLIEKSNIILEYDLDNSTQIGDKLVTTAYGITQDKEGLSWFTSNVNIDTASASSKKWSSITEEQVFKNKINSYSILYNRDSKTMDFGPRDKMNVQIGFGEIRINSQKVEEGTISSLVNSIIAVNGGLNFYCDNSI